jgi:hypothetical protein
MAGGALVTAGGAAWPGTPISMELSTNWYASALSATSFSNICRTLLPSVFVNVHNGSILPLAILSFTFASTVMFIS